MSLKVLSDKIFDNKNMVDQGLKCVGEDLKTKSVQFVEVTLGKRSQEANCEGS